MNSTDSTEPTHSSGQGAAPSAADSAPPSPKRVAQEANLRHLRERALTAGQAVETAQARVLSPANLTKKLSVATPEQAAQLRQDQADASDRADQARAEARAAEAAYENALHAVPVPGSPPPARDRDDT